MLQSKLASKVEEQEKELSAMLQDKLQLLEELGLFE